jgi:DNA-binding beta-propeller fold protein YncE
MDPSVGVLLTLLRSARPVVVLFLITICVACGDTFRPVAIPIVPAPPSPAASHFVLVINGNGFGTIGNGTFNQGTSTRIDVSGDTNVGVAPLGLGPVHAALLPNSSQLYVANFLEDTVSSFAPTSIGPITTVTLPRTTVNITAVSGGGSNTNYTYTLTAGPDLQVGESIVITGITGLPNLGDNGTFTITAVVPLTSFTVTNAGGVATSGQAGSGVVPSSPVFVHTTENGTVYVANYSYGTVAAISTANNVVSTMAPADPSHSTSIQNPVPQPVALAETPDGKKLYMVNLGNSSVTSINTTDLSVNPIITNVNIIAPAWAVARADSARVYVLNSSSVLNSNSGTVSVIDTTTDTVLNSVPAGPSIKCVGQPQTCGFMLYDKTRTRLYVTNPASTKVVVLDASTDALNALASVDLTTAPNSVCGGGCFPVSIAVLPDGSRAYVASYQLGTDPITGKASISAGVTVFSTTANTITGTIALGSTDIDAANPTGCGPTVPPLSAPPMRFRLSTAASADGTRVYVSSCDLGSTSIIDTFPSTAKADSLGLELPASASDFQPSTVTVSAASPSGLNTTYNYTVSTSLPPLRVGMKMVITGMTDAANNGTFSITAVDPKTFTVVNSGVAASGQNGTGIATTPQNPVFTLAGP